MKYLGIFTIISLSIVFINVFLFNSEEKSEISGNISDLPFACTLNGDELVERKSTILSEIQKFIIEEKEKESGYSIRFQPDEDLLSRLTEIINLEKQCCSFLKFTLIVEPNNGPIWLELTGPDGTKEYLKDLFSS